MYHDEAEDRYYATRRDFERMQILTQLRRGLLKEIHGFERYTITPEGVVINIHRAMPVKPHMTKGRLSIGLTNNRGERRTMGLARLIASHFSNMPPDDQYYDVVHKDNDLLNVHPNNLMWVARWKVRANPNNYDMDIS